VNTRRQGSETAEEAESTLRLLDGAGQPLSDSLTIPGQITTLHVTDLDLDNQPDIFVATAAGDIYAYSLALVEWWTGRVQGHVTALLALDEQRLLAATRDNDIYLIDNTGNSRLLVNYNLRTIVALHPLPAANLQEPALLVTADDGTLRGLNWDGREIWQLALNAGRPTVTIPAGDHFLIATDTGRLFELDNTYALSEWALENDAPISALTWADLNGGGPADVAIGRRNGTIELY